MGDTEFSNILIVLDLTKKQREEAAEMMEDVERKRENLTEDDIANNLKWTVVGAPGEKRLIKRTRERGGGLTGVRKRQDPRLKGQVNVHQSCSFLVYDVTVHLVYRSPNVPQRA